MKILKVANWKELQHYKDRNPPWIKLYKRLLRKRQFYDLPETTRSHLLCIWLMAAEHDNEIEYDPGWIKEEIHAKSHIDFDRLIKDGWLQVFENGRLISASVSLASCQQSATSETETETETEVESSRVGAGEIGKELADTAADMFVSEMAEKVAMSGRASGSMLVEVIRDSVRFLGQSETRQICRGASNATNPVAYIRGAIEKKRSGVPPQRHVREVQPSETLDMDRLSRAMKR